MDLSPTGTQIRNAFVNLLIDVYGEQNPIENRQQLYDNLIAEQGFSFRIAEEVNDPTQSFIRSYNGLPSFLNITNARRIFSHPFIMNGLNLIDDQPNFFFSVAKLLLMKTYFNYLVDDTFYNRRQGELGNWTKTNQLIPRNYIVDISIENAYMTVRLEKNYVTQGEINKGAVLTIKIPRRR
jgi:hypothetical protein